MNRRSFWVQQGRKDGRREVCTLTYQTSSFCQNVSWTWIFLLFCTPHFTEFSSISSRKFSCFHVPQKLRFTHPIFWKIACVFNTSMLLFIWLISSLSHFRTWKYEKDDQLWGGAVAFSAINWWTRSSQFSFTFTYTLFSIFNTNIFVCSILCERRYSYSNTRAASMTDLYSFTIQSVYVSPVLLGLFFLAIY